MSESVISKGNKLDQEKSYPGVRVPEEADVHFRRLEGPDQLSLTAPAVRDGSMRRCLLTNTGQNPVVNKKGYSADRSYLTPCSHFELLMFLGGTFCTHLAVIPGCSHLDRACSLRHHPFSQRRRR